MQSRRRRSAGVVAIVASVVLLSGCQIAKTGKVAADAPDIVSVDPAVASGATVVNLDTGTLANLSSQGITLHPLGKATVTGTTVSFPITSGYAEVHSRTDTKPNWIQGSLDHATSGLTVSDGGTTVTVDDLVVNPGTGTVTATIAGKVGVPLLSLDMANETEAINEGGQIVVGGVTATLTADAAQALDTAFATPAISQGTSFGAVSLQIGLVAPLPQGATNLTNAGLTGATYNASRDHVTAIPTLTGQSTTITLESSVSSALNAKGLTLGTSGSATSSGDAVTLPITAGFLAVHSDTGFQPHYVVGTIDHQGSGITITSAGGASLALQNLVINPGTAAVSGTVKGRANTPLFSLDESQLQVSGTNLSGLTADLTDQSAQALDTAFGTNAFQPGIAVATVQVTASGS